jgi:predicted HTH transcriptional regulator
MELSELRQLAERGESAELEFKRKANHPEKIAREFVAFANSSGGIVLIGVDDDGSVYGCKFPEEEAFAMEQALERHCRPKIRFLFERVKVSGKREVLVYHIKESRFKPVFLRDPETGKKSAFVRVEDMSVSASIEWVSVTRHSRRRHGVKIKYGDDERQLLNLLENKKQITLEDAYASLKLSRRHTSHLLIRLTRAGLLRLHPTAGDDYYTLSEEAFRH